MKVCQDYIKEMEQASFGLLIMLPCILRHDKYWILQNCPMLGSGAVIDLLAGSAAGGTSVLCTYPLDLAQEKLAFQWGKKEVTEEDICGNFQSRPAENLSWCPVFVEHLKHAWIDFGKI